MRVRTTKVKTKMTVNSVDWDHQDTVREPNEKKVIIIARAVMKSLVSLWKPNVSEGFQ